MGDEILNSKQRQCYRYCVALIIMMTLTGTLIGKKIRSFGSFMFRMPSSLLVSHQVLSLQFMWVSRHHHYKFGPWT